MQQQTKLLLRLNHSMPLLKDMLQVKSVMSNMCGSLKYHFPWSYFLLPLLQMMRAEIVIPVGPSECYLEFLLIMKAFHFCCCCWILPLNFQYLSSSPFPTNLSPVHFHLLTRLSLQLLHLYLAMTFLVPF